MDQRKSKGPRTVKTLMKKSIILAGLVYTFIIRPYYLRQCGNGTGKPMQQNRVHKHSCLYGETASHGG